MFLQRYRAILTLDSATLGHKLRHPTIATVVLFVSVCGLLADFASAAVVNPQYDPGAAGWSFISSVPGNAGPDTPNSPGSTGGSAFTDIAVWQPLSDLAAANTNYTLSVFVFNDRNTLGGNTANDPDPPKQDTLGLPLHLRLYAADGGENPTNAFVLGSLNIGTTGNPLPNSNTWGQYILTVPAASIPPLELNKSLLISLETNSLVTDSWVYADQWNLVATAVPEPSTLLLISLSLLVWIRGLRFRGSMGR